jgi:hypothetical protein
MDNAAALHPLVVSATDDLAVANQDGADRDAAFGQTGAGFVQRALEKLIHSGV